MKCIEQKNEIKPVFKIKSRNVSRCSKSLKRDMSKTKRDNSLTHKTTKAVNGLKLKLKSSNESKTIKSRAHSTSEFGGISNQLKSERTCCRYPLRSISSNRNIESSKITLKSISKHKRNNKTIVNHKNKEVSSATQKDFCSKLNSVFKWLIVQNLSKNNSFVRHHNFTSAIF